MFTGIIEETAEILEITPKRISIKRPSSFDDIVIGSSICINGICLSVVDLDDQSVHFDVMEETGNNSTIGLLQKGDRVNLERALKANGRFEGHVVQGHSEGKAACTWDGDHRLQVTIPEYLLPFVVEKGSIAINGVSLTVATLQGNICTVALIPHTLKETTFQYLQNGDMVNIETDILARHAHMALAQAPHLTLS